MVPKRVIQIVPARARRAEGVGDYARIVAEGLRADAEVETSFVSCTALAPADRCDDGWETIELSVRSAGALSHSLDGLQARYGSLPLLLHLSGYGFDRRGAPFWLARALRRWRRRNPSQKLVIVFHELFANGPVFTRRFWLGRVQRFVTRALQRISSAGIVTLGRNLRWLEGAGADAPPSYLSPCFATIGETDTALEPASQRAARLVIFGRTAVLPEIYGEWAEVLEAFVRENAIVEIIDIGPRTAPPPGKIGGAIVTRMGELDPATLRDALSGARFGMLRYDADWLPKSSILAAYCAHGVIPVCLSGQRGESDGLLPGANYLRLDREHPIPCPQLSEIDELQRRAQAWYSPHSIDRTITLLRTLIG